jgi:menaquinone-dependent protoporphyrinogen oxidase
VIGSAVYAKRWRRPARKLLHSERETLAHHPLWIFSSGPVGPDEPDPDWLEPAAGVREAERLGARGHVVFGGRVPADPGNFIERAMVRNTPPEHQDKRDWDEIRGWARGVATAIETSEAVTP